MLCFTFAASCNKEPVLDNDPEDTAGAVGDTESDGAETEGTEDGNTEEITVLSLDKEYVSHYEWYEDYPKMLVRSEYSSVVLDESSAEEYSALAKALEETSAMRKRAMEDEKDNLLSFATEDFMNDGEAFSTCVSTLDVKVRRADSVAVSVLEDYNSGGDRGLNGINYDAESGKELTLSDVVKDTSKIAVLVEAELMKRTGDEYSEGDSAVFDYLNGALPDGVCFTLEYNGITFWFEAGEIAPTNLGIQTVTLTFGEHPDLFVEKYTAVPDAYVVALPMTAWNFTDLTGDSAAEGIFLTGEGDAESGTYVSIDVNTDTSYYSEKWDSCGFDPYYVKTADSGSYLYVFGLKDQEEDRESTLAVFTLKNGEVKLLNRSEIGLLGKGEGSFALPTDPDGLLLDAYDGKTDAVFSADENGITAKP